MRKKFTTEEKLNAVHAYLDGTTSQKKLAKNLGTSQAVVQRWLANYQLSLIHIFRNHSVPAEPWYPWKKRSDRPCSACRHRGAAFQPGPWIPQAL